MADIRKLTGSIVALVTPFAANGSVDFEALGHLVDFHLENGTDAILALGTTGESSTMTHEEDNEVVRFVVERVAGRIPVIAGSGSNSTQTMLEKSLEYQRLGADGLLLITPTTTRAMRRASTSTSPPWPMRWTCPASSTTSPAARVAASPFATLSV